jgi:uncharacterized paraquat-inducible protein A
VSPRLDQRLRRVSMRGPQQADWVSCPRCRASVPLDARERQVSCPYCDSALKRPRLTRLSRLLLALLAFLTAAVVLAHFAAR